MKAGSSGRSRILIVDKEFAGSVPKVASNFPQLELICATDDQSALSLAGSEIKGLVCQFETVSSELLAPLDGLNAVLKVGRSYYNIDVEAVRQRNYPGQCAAQRT